MVCKANVFRNRIAWDSLCYAIRFILDDVQVLSWCSKALEELKTDEDGLERTKLVHLPGLTKEKIP